MRKIHSNIYLIITIIFLFNLSITPLVFPIEQTNNIIKIKTIVSPTFEGYTDLNVDEVWNLVNDTSNGIQYLIDVRYDAEWIMEHIDAPYPEYARHHCKCEWVDESILQDFMDTYQGKEIILYCQSGGRSASAATTLVENEFDGIIYNMIGGITSWKNNGYPTIGNRAPQAPQITGPNIGIPKHLYNFTISTQDFDFDKVFYQVKWGDGESEIYIKPYESGEEVVFSHAWSSTGYHTIEVKARDYYFEESPWTFFEMNISTTELSISSIQKGFGQIRITIQNIGEYSATNLESTISINGGLFSNINLTYSSSESDELDAGEQMIISSIEAGFIFGIGPIEIFVSTSANNAKIKTASEKAFVLGPMII